MTFTQNNGLHTVNFILSIIVANVLLLSHLFVIANFAKLRRKTVIYSSLVWLQVWYWKLLWHAVRPSRCIQSSGEATERVQGSR